MTKIIIGLICLIPIIFFIGHFIGKRSYKKYVDNLFRSGKGKFGIIIYYTYSRVEYIFEVEELESAGDLTKVRLIRICSCAGDSDSNSKILSSKSFNEWVKTKDITWYDDNSQRMRDEKLKQILGN